jgi:hypothetical protein
MSDVPPQRWSVTTVSAVDRGVLDVHAVIEYAMSAHSHNPLSHNEIIRSADISKHKVLFIAILQPCIRPLPKATFERVKCAEVASVCWVNFDAFAAPTTSQYKANGRGLHRTESHLISAMSTPTFTVGQRPTSAWDTPPRQSVATPLSKRGSTTALTAC